MNTVSRRSVLQGLKALMLILAFPFTSVRNVRAEWFPTRTVEKKDFTFDPTSGMLLRKGEERGEPYKLVVDGLVRKPLELSYSDLRKLPVTTQVSDFHCVEGWTIPQVKWSGFRFSEILKLVEPLDEAKYVTFHALGETRYKPRGQSHYIESFKVASLLDAGQEILMTLDKDGKPLSLERGAPVRVIAPYRLAYKSIKFVHRVEFSEEKQSGWWTLANPVYSWGAHVPRRRLEKPE